MKNKKNRIVKNEVLINNNQSGIKDQSPIIPQRSKFKGELTITTRPDLTPKQLDLIDIILDKNVKMVFVKGPAGTTKSFLAVYASLKLIEDKKISDIIYVRSAVESASHSLGYLKGDLPEKFSVYMEPLMDKLSELLPKNQIDILKKERVSGIPINFLRGANFNAKSIILDEAQNLNVKELTTFVTRIGQYSKAIILGDPEQSDINGKSGFYKFFNLFNDSESRSNGIVTFEFTEDDILRSELVKFIVKKLRMLT